MESEGQAESADARLKAHLARECEGCGQAAWLLEPETFSLVGVGADNALNLRRGMSVHALVCRGCGLVRLVNSNVVFRH